ncbi:MAG: transposase [Maricaulaceae bacterium]
MICPYPRSLCAVVYGVWQSSYGTRLKALVFYVGRRRVTRLMREDGLQGRIKRRFKCATNSAHNQAVAYSSLNMVF